MLVAVTAILCVTGLVLGQILFKISAISLVQTGSFFALKTASWLVVALSLYTFVTIVWVWLLQRVELGRVYPFMALAFILLPLGSYFVFGERFQPQYFLGVGLIMVGIFVVLSS